jgi:p-aminobenzoyl-glutamate transporter AbgT
VVVFDNALVCAIVIQIIVFAFGYGIVVQKVNDVRDRVKRIEDKIFNGREKKPA